MPEARPSPERQTSASDVSTQEARIEHLLVTGLDHYFAGEFEQAINLWTRVLFLDRAHDRARAYIERARSAQAEAQRQGEALVHQGLAAFDRGEVEEARALLHDAMARGASHDLALGVLGRIDRLDRPGARHEPEVTTPRTVPRWRANAQPARAGVRTGGGRSLALWITIIALVGASGVGAAWWASVTGVSLPEFLIQPGASAGPIVAAPLPDPSPVPAAAERYLLRGRALFAGGRLREALVDLERIPLGDPLRPDADRLRGQIQRELLAVAASDMTPVSAAPPRPPE